MMGSHLLHGLVCASVRVLPLPSTLRLMRALGARLPSFTPAECGEVARHLRGGTCLTRALTLAARTPGAAVVIGGTKVHGAFAAHAWVEVEGTTISGHTASDQVLVRLS
jgi:hypothetical protein